MPPTPDEIELRARFDELRREEQARVPAYRPPDRQPKRRPAMRKRFLAAAAMLLIVFAIASWRASWRRDAPPSATTNAPSFQWTAPTDFLLQTPQSDLLRTTPRFGAPLSLPKGS